MAKQGKSARSARPGGRELVLAGIGAVSLARKQAGKAYGALVREGNDFSATVSAAGERVRKQVRQRIGAARAALEPRSRILRVRVTQAVGDIREAAQPLLARFGIAAPTPAQRKAKRKPATPAARKAAGRKTAAGKARRKAA